MKTPTARMTIRVNDAELPVQADATIHDLLCEMGFSEIKGIAVALNNEVVSRSAWLSRKLRENDSVLVIQATQGG